MPSRINTALIEPNYPIARVNNCSQPFRDNFSSIKANINIASDEITELQEILASLINDNIITNTNVWSSNKTNAMLLGLINDSNTSTQTVWSSTKTEIELAKIYALIGDIDALLDNINGN